MTSKSIDDWMQTFSTITRESNFSAEVIIAPSYIHLEKTSRITGLLNIKAKIAAQNAHYEKSGAYTGSVSIKQISEYCKYCILNHTETKTSKENLTKAINLCRSENVIPIICFVDIQDLPENVSSTDIIAWEDPQNISKDGVYKPKDPLQIIKTVRQLRETKLKNNVLIYGGSVNKDNILDLVKIPEIDGVLPGNASLDPTHFFEIIKIYSSHI
jgi:triosephosphate isomerase